MYEILLKRTDLATRRKIEPKEQAGTADIVMLHSNASLHKLKDEVESASRRNTNNMEQLSNIVHDICVSSFGAIKRKISSPMDDPSTQKLLSVIRRAKIKRCMKA